MKTRLAVTAAALLVAVLAGVAVSCWPGGRSLRLGTILPLTGPNAAIGRGMRNSIRLAVDEVNGRGGVQGRKVELVELDDASLPEKAEAAARKLAADSRVLAGLVHYDPDCFAATQLLLGEAGLPNLVAGVSNLEQGSLGLGRSPTEFHLLPLGSAQMTQAARYAWEILGARTFLFVGDDTSLGLSMVNQFRAALTPLVGKLVTGGDVMIHAGDRDFSALVAKIRAEAPQYVLFGGRPQEAALLVSQLRAAGVTSWFQSATHFPSQEFIDLAKDQAEGALAVFPGLPPDASPGGKAFLEAYAAKGYSDPPSSYGLYSYAAAQAMLAALERSFLTRPSVTGALRNEGFQTAVGPVRFHFLGSTYQSVAIYKVVKGRWTPIYATDKSNQLKPL